MEKIKINIGGYYVSECIILLHKNLTPPLNRVQRNIRNEYKAMFARMPYRLKNYSTSYFAEKCKVCSRLVPVQCLGSSLNGESVQERIRMKHLNKVTMIVIYYDMIILYSVTVDTKQCVQMQVRYYYCNNLLLYNTKRKTYII